MPVIINGSTGISGTDGSAGTPAVQGTDPNTGMYFPAADTIAFSEGGVEALRLDSTGRAIFSGNATFNAGLVPSSSFLRNRIINGDMRIDQRNAGAAVTVNNNSAFYSVDRFFGLGQNADGVFTLQRSTVAPSGFTNSLLATVTTADASVGAGQLYTIAQFIEGFNAADFAWGSAAAVSVTLSFWVRSSVTGTYGGSIRNALGNRSYPFTYSISAANTFEFKTITITGDTTGTWATDNTSGPQIWFGLGVGSVLSGTAGAWNSNNNVSATGATNWISTNGATFYLTGVQLEVGSAATPFERRLVGQEISLCQRYYTQSDFTEYHNLAAPGATYLGVYRINMPVQMRANPSVGVNYSSSNAIQSFGWYTQNYNFMVHYIIASVSTNAFMYFTWTASAEL